MRDASGNVLAIYEKKTDQTLAIKEIPIYGGSRLGQYRPKTDTKKTALGQRIYEFSNHLGNVLVTLTDNKVPQTDGTYESVVVSASDYYPFGMAMKERTFSNESYRYGFNGQEQSDELDQNGNSYTAEYWQYDARLGRRWNVDPIDKPWESSYSSFAGNPIWHIDPNGDDWYVATQGGNNAEALWLQSDKDADKFFGENQYINLGDKLLREVVKSESKYFSFRENWDYYGSFSAASRRLEDEWLADDSYLVVGAQAFGKGVTQSNPIYSLWSIGSGMIEGENPYGEKMDGLDIALESVSFLPVGKVLKYGKGLFKKPFTLLKKGQDWMERTPFGSKFGVDKATINNSRRLTERLAKEGDEGYYTVLSHGAGGFHLGNAADLGDRLVGANEVYDMIMKEGYDGIKNIRLVVCNSGTGVFAQQMANISGKTVIAPQSRIALTDDLIFVFEGKGFKKFIPEID